MKRNSCNSERFFYLERQNDICITGLSAGGKVLVSRDKSGWLMVKCLFTNSREKTAVLLTVPKKAISSAIIPFCASRKSYTNFSIEKYPSRLIQKF